MNGKGSTPRPIKDRANYGANYDRIFRKPKKKTKTNTGNQPRDL